MENGEGIEQSRSSDTARENENDENAILTNEEGIGDDPIRRGESTSAMAASDLEQRPKSLEGRNSKVSKNDDIITGTDSPNQRNTPENQRSGSGGGAVIQSVSGSTKISKVDRPNTSSPIDQDINYGSKKNCAEEPEDPIETEIELVSNPHNQKKVKRMPRYTYKTFNDCPCAFCRPKAKRPPNACQNQKDSDNENTDKHSLGDKNAQNGEATEENSTDKQPQIEQQERKPVVIPRTQCEVKVVQGKGGVSIDSEQAVTEIPQNIIIQRVMDPNAVNKSSMLWRIESVADKIQSARRQDKVTIYSTPFYTAPHGYRIMAATCPFGTGAGFGKCIPIFFFVCRGKYDNLLPWPLKASITVRLLDQNPDIDSRRDITITFTPDPEDERIKEALQQPKKERNNYFGVAKFAPLAALKRKYFYVRDDAMFIQIFVDKEEMPVI